MNYMGVTYEAPTLMILLISLHIFMCQSFRCHPMRVVLPEERSVRVI